MNVIIAGRDSLGVLIANVLSKEGHNVLLAEQEGVHLRSLPKNLVNRENVTLIEIDPRLDESMIQMDIRRCDLFIAATLSGPDNGLMALKAKITYQVDKVIALVTDEAFSSIYPSFGVTAINPHSMVLEGVTSQLGLFKDDDVGEDSDDEPSLEELLASFE